MVRVTEGEVGEVENEAVAVRACDGAVGKGPRPLGMQTAAGEPYVLQSPEPAMLKYPKPML